MTSSTAGRDRTWASRSPRAAAVGLILCAVAACGVRRPTHPELATVAQQDDSLALSDALEVLIGQGKDTLTDRVYAYNVVSSRPVKTAADAFARAAVTGRVVQAKGLRAAKLVGDVERYAQQSRELDPTFRQGAATRMLGTLYVIAPASLLEHGDSETGLEILEELTDANPEVPENHLRLAEAYVTLHDPDPARPHLCFSLAHQAELRPDDQALLKWLIADAGPLDCPPSPASPHPAGSGKGSTTPPATR